MWVRGDDPVREAYSYQGGHPFLGPAAYLLVCKMLLGNVSANVVLLNMPVLTMLLIGEHDGVDLISVVIWDPAFGTSLPYASHPLVKWLPPSVSTQVVLPLVATVIAVSGSDHHLPQQLGLQSRATMQTIGAVVPEEGQELVVKVSCRL